MAVSSHTSRSLHDANGATLLDISHPVNVGDRGHELETELILERLDLAAGEYTVAVGVHAPEFLHAFDFLWEAVRFEIVGLTASTSYLPPHTWRAG